VEICQYKHGHIALCSLEGSSKQEVSTILALTIHIREPLFCEAFMLPWNVQDCIYRNLDGFVKISLTPDVLTVT
jgi:hypothetical protein